jgi:site-specific recombinase XerD
MTLVPHQSSTELAEFSGLIEQAEGYLRASRSKNTLRVYQSDLRLWVDWCERRGISPLPGDPGEVALFITAEASRVKPGTVARRLSSLRWAHEQAGYQSPTSHPKVRGVLAGVKRVHASDPIQRRPIYLEDLKAMVNALDFSTNKGLRDRAVLVAGWWSACRRSEIAALTVSSLAEVPEGFVLRVGRSKTDQEGRGRLIPLAYFEDSPVCPVRALRSWLEVVEEGPLFRSVSRWDHVSDGAVSGEAVSQIVKRAGEAIGLDPSTLGGHSLRAGFVSDMDRHHVPDRVITAITGHKSTAMLSTYSRPRFLFADGPARYFKEGETQLSAVDR